ncbi:MAG TPA: nucleotidyl transferase AbiEii/AbiGii toxin family protein [Geminicoccaceae bacterium]|nr:nucleotidyl transferase AbiEii/AbiGii toxin family protein [Geminicoccaceae bacterium]
MAPVLRAGGTAVPEEELYLKPRLEILPPGQRRFWDNYAGRIPDHYVLYGGTAIALRFGHRASVDFDFFSDVALDEGELRRALSILDRATVLQRAPNTFVASVDVDGGPVRLSFFGGLRIGRVAEPDQPEGAAIAAPLDLLATKLKALHDRIEAKDYLDIEALLRSGLTLNEGIGAAMTLFGRALNPLDTAKAVAWFRDGGLEASLPEQTRSYLTAASARFDPATKPLPLKSRRLAPDDSRADGAPSGSAT